MTAQGIIALWIFGLAYLLWIVNLSRRGRLYAGYATVWVVWIILGLLIVSIEPLLSLTTRLVGAVYSASALTLLAFVVLFALQIYLLSQLSIISRRVALLSQYVAIEKSERASPNSAKSAYEV
jgi:hypothetical protein